MIGWVVMLTASALAEPFVRLEVEAPASGPAIEVDGLRAHLLERARSAGWAVPWASRTFVVTLAPIGTLRVRVRLAEGEQVLADRELAEPSLAALKSTAWLMVRLTLTRALRPAPQERPPPVSPTPEIPAATAAAPSFTLPDAPPAVPVPKRPPQPEVESRPPVRAPPPVHPPPAAVEGARAGWAVGASVGIADTVGHPTPAGHLHLIADLSPWLSAGASAGVVHGTVDALTASTRFPVSLSLVARWPALAWIEGGIFGAVDAELLSTTLGLRSAVGVEAGLVAGVRVPVAGTWSVVARGRLGIRVRRHQYVSDVASAEEQLWSPAVEVGPEWSWR